MRRPAGGVPPTLILGLCALAAGCQDVSVRRVRRDPSADRAGELARLRDHFDLARERPDNAGPPRLEESSFPSLIRPDDPPDELLARSARSYQAGGGAERASKDVAASFYLNALTFAEASVASTPAKGADEAGRELYNASLAEFLRASGGKRLRLDEAWRSRLAARGVRVTVLRDGAVWPTDRFNEYLFPEDWAVQGLENQYHAEGVGVPLIAMRRFDFKELETRKGEEKFLMPRQIEPVTALLRVMPPSGDRPGAIPEYRLELHDPLRASRVEFAGRTEPLASDLSTPLAYHLARGPLPVLQEIGLLQPEWVEKLTGLYMMHPYQRGKIPVVFVHGLRSSHLAWLKVLNELQGDPAIRARYQFWLFLYPSGVPFPLSAATLRKDLVDLRHAVDPRRSDRSFDDMVVVGHSMGGLISKMLTEESGDAIWNLFSARPFDELRADPERRDLLRRTFFFEPVASVRRVVFIATPHRGSELGDQFIGRLADKLVRLPSSLRLTYKTLLAQNGADFFSPASRAGLHSSVSELRRDNPLLVALNKLPTNPDVIFHSIIGKKQPELPLEASSDGVVPYVSAHLEKAESECVVPGDHGCQDGPQTIAEIRRILYVHLAQSARERKEAAANAPLEEIRRERRVSGRLPAFRQLLW